jgi:hypothetical protein
MIGERKDRVALDTGPAFDPTRKIEVSFLRLRPTKIWLRIPVGQLKVIAQARDVLISLGADIVVTMPVLDKAQKGKAI